MISTILLIWLFIQCARALPQVSGGGLRGQRSVISSRLWAEGTLLTSPWRELWASLPGPRLVRSQSGSQSQVPSPPHGPHRVPAPPRSPSQIYSSPGLPWCSGNTPVSSSRDSPQLTELMMGPAVFLSLLSGRFQVITLRKMPIINDQIWFKMN